jgi:hypothetical protein
MRSCGIKDECLFTCISLTYDDKLIIIWIKIIDCWVTINY